MAVHCTHCPAVLVPHCANPDCTWMDCRNPRCDAVRFETWSGRLRLSSGRVVNWDEA